jgi:hypothetical protein
LKLYWKPNHLTKPPSIPIDEGEEQEVSIELIPSTDLKPREYTHDSG